MNRKKLFSDKTAEVPVVVLVLGVLLLCVLVFVNYTLFSNQGDKYGGLEKVVGLEECMNHLEQYTFYEKIGISDIGSLPNFKKGDEKIIISENGGDVLICSIEEIKIKYPLS